MKSLEVNGVLSTAGGGKTLYLIAKVCEKVVEGKEQNVMYVSSEHVPQHILGKIEEETAGVEKKNDLSVHFLSDANESLDAVHKCIFNLSAQKELHLFLDIHDKHLLDEVLTFVLMLPQVAKIFVTVSQQVRAGDKITKPVEKSLVYTGGSLSVAK